EAISSRASSGARSPSPPSSCYSQSSFGHLCGDCSAHSSGFRSQSPSLLSAHSILQPAGLLSCSDLPGAAGLPRKWPEALFTRRFGPRDLNSLWWEQTEAPIDPNRKGVDVEVGGLVIGCLHARRGC